ncbi:MAG: hypothetical protein PHC92_05265, partial [Syntrophomonadaceae bacterium]|nr:hypothetical protein [Syntrophomonadaceae bacterium]
LLALEIITLGIKFMAPESAAAEAITKFQVGMVDTLGDFRNQIVGLFDRDDKKAEEEKTPVEEEPEEPEQTQEEEKPVVIDTTPAKDKAVLIEEAKASNNNISSVTANPDLAYVSGKDYGSSAINNSVPLTENVWREDAKGNSVLYDQEIVRTLIAFDSGWIDYVNGGSDSVIDLTKEGSRAYRSASSYSKVGKINETFDALEIGEIRKGGDGYYAWVFEKITKTEAGRTSSASYHWIYYLEPIGNEMKIVDYIKY